MHQIQVLFIGFVVHCMQITVRNFLQPHPIYQCVSALRCLYLRDSNPAMWERLQSLQSHCANRKATPRYEADRVTVAQFVRRFFNLHNFEEEEILRICGILQVRHSYVILGVATVHKHQNCTALSNKQTNKHSSGILRGVVW
jgi:hypothetical protein